MLQQPELRRPEMHIAHAAADAVCRAVDMDVAEAHGIGRKAWAHTAEHRANTRQEFGRRKRLGDVVVGADIEAADTVGFLAPAP